MMNNFRYIPEINGVEHSWANININILGVTILGVTKISYKDEQQIDNIYGAGANPISRGFGRITPSANITLLRGEIEAIRAASPTGRLQDIAPFDIVVAYIPMQGQKMITHIIKNAQFKIDGVDWSEGDVKNEHSFELVISHIVWKSLI